MPARAWRSPAAARSPKSLAARGGLVRTFGGLATFLVLTFLCAGIYLLEDAVVNPLAAQAAALYLRRLHHRAGDHSAFLPHQAGEWRANVPGATAAARRVAAEKQIAWGYCR